MCLTKSPTGISKGLFSCDTSEPLKVWSGNWQQLIILTWLFAGRGCGASGKTLQREARELGVCSRPCSTGGRSGGLQATPCASAQPPARTSEPPRAPENKLLTFLPPLHPDPRPLPLSHSQIQLWLVPIFLRLQFLATPRKRHPSSFLEPQSPILGSKPPWSLEFILFRAPG